MALITAALIGVVGSVAGGIGASKSAEAAREAAQINTYLARAFRTRTEENLEGVEYDPVDPMAFMGQAEDLTEWGRNILRTAAYGEENLEGADNLRSSLLRQAQFDFSDIPPDALQAMDTSALARSYGGPGGLTENISLANRIDLANRGLQGFQQQATMEAGFTPNPVTNLWDLAKFETSNRLTQLDLDRWRIGQQIQADQWATGVEMGAVESRAENNAAAANWTATGNVLQSVGTAISGYQTGMTQQANSNMLQQALQSSLASLGGGGRA
jgi:hypothetical protein